MRSNHSFHNFGRHYFASCVNFLSGLFSRSRSDSDSDAASGALWFLVFDLGITQQKNNKVWDQPKHAVKSQNPKPKHKTKTKMCVHLNPGAFSSFFSSYYFGCAALRGGGTNAELFTTRAPAHPSPPFLFQRPPRSRSSPSVLNVFAMARAMCASFLCRLPRRASEKAFKLNDAMLMDESASGPASIIDSSSSQRPRPLPASS